MKNRNKKIELIVNRNELLPECLTPGRVRLCEENGPATTIAYCTYFCEYFIFTFSTYKVVWMLIQQGTSYIYQLFTVNSYFFGVR